MGQERGGILFFMVRKLCYYKEGNECDGRILDNNMLSVSARPWFVEMENFKVGNIMFEGYTWQQKKKFFNFKHKVFIPYHPKTLRQVEVSNRQLNFFYIEKSVSSWGKDLSKIKVVGTICDKKKVSPHGAVKQEESSSERSLKVIRQRLKAYFGGPISTERVSLIVKEP